MSHTPETTITTKEASAVEQLAVQTGEHPYNEYWSTVAEMYGGSLQSVEGALAERNQRQFEQLESTLVSAGEGHNQQVGKAAEEWYLKLGSFNQLQGAGGPLTVGFVRLWEAARGKAEPSSNVEKAFYEAATEIHSTRDGAKISESIRGMARDPERAGKALLAGNVMLDYVRSVPHEERKATHKQFLGLAYQLNHELLSGVVNNGQELSPKEQRIASDALKFKYEAAYELLATDKETGVIDEDTYQAKFNAFLSKQLKETSSLSQGDKITNGDLHEHYFMALVRYGKTGWQDETRFLVQGATRRQDEPHDSFAHKRLPLCSFDAKIVDTEGEVSDQYVQLKMPGASDMPYADGIVVVDSMLSEDAAGESLGARNYAAREELNRGISQLRGLVHELSTGTPYQGKTDTVSEHLKKVDAVLQLQG